MAGNQVTLTIAGDASQLQRAAQQAEQAMTEVEDSVSETNDAMAEGSTHSQDLGTRMGNLGNAVDGASTAIDDAATAFQTIADLQTLSARRADEVKRNFIAVEQASSDLNMAFGDLAQAKRDLNMAMLDGKQAVLDEEAAQIAARQAVLDAAVAQEEYNTAVKEHGANSAEALQASIDLATAQNDLKQANLDVEVAQEDAKQAIEDGNAATLAGTQASIDAKSAQLDLNEAQRAANPSQLQKVADVMNILAPIMTGLIGILGLVTAAQWAWNAAQLASPTTWIVIGIIALIAVIVLIATKTDWFAKLWDAIWKGIVAYFKFVIGFYQAGWNMIWDAGKAVIGWFQRIPSMLASAFSTVFSVITAPWRAAFNFIADAWNNTIGRLSWTVPSWVPGVGGHSISAPKLPKFHGGGTVPGPPGSEMLAILQAGETVTPAGRSTSASSDRSWLPTGDVLADLVLEALAARSRARGGDPSIYGISNG